MDRSAFAHANRLLGNDPSAAVLELLGGGAMLQFLRQTWFVVTGAEGPVLLDGRRVDRGIPGLAGPGSVLAIGAPDRGLRYTVAVRGGVDVPETLGSRSTDVLAGLGPEPVSAGTTLPIGVAVGAGVAAIDVFPLDPPVPRDPGEAAELSIVPGPRLDRFASDAWSRLLAAEWTVSVAADRTGIRLDGPELERVVTDELPSEGMVAGALQVPPSGRPTILGPDHPVTGGYPVIAVVRRRSLDALAHLAPGRPLRFTTR